MEEQRTFSRALIAILKFGAVYNILAGLSMMILYHEGFKLLGVEKPEFNLPIQLVGLLVAIFGIGYWMVARDPVENRNVLLLGLLSKFFGPLLAVAYIAQGILPVAMLAVLFFADTIYLLPYWMVYKKACVIAGEAKSSIASSTAASSHKVDDQVKQKQGLARSSIKKSA